MTFKSCILTAAVAALVFCPHIALADGMPSKAAKPLPALTTLDKALEDIQGREKKPPVDVTAVPVVPAVAPAPVDRTVEVQPETSFLGLSVGMYDAVTHGDQAAAFTLEFQPGVRILGVIKPLFGIMATTDNTMYGYGGLGVPLRITDHVKFMPSLAFGAYDEGDGVDLGRTGIFRIGGELAYQFDNQSRFGVNAYVLTNAESTQRDDRTEVFSLFYALPLQAKAD